MKSLQQYITEALVNNKLDNTIQFSSSVNNKFSKKLATCTTLGEIIKTCLEVDEIEDIDQDDFDSLDLAYVFDLDYISYEEFIDWAKEHENDKLKYITVDADTFQFATADKEFDCDYVAESLVNNKVTNEDKPKIGHTAYDYNDEPWTINAFCRKDEGELVGVRSLKELIRKFDNSGTMAEELNEVEDTEFIVGAHNDQYGYAAWIWGPDGIFYKD